MKPLERMIWAMAIVIADFLVFVVPVTAILAAYVLIVRPPWFRDLVSKLYGD